LNFLKDNREAFAINFAFWPAELYSAQFSMDLLLLILDCCQSTSLGLSGFYNQMLSHLPPRDKVLLLSMYNCMWWENSDPAAMWVVTVVPLPYQVTVIPSQLVIDLSCWLDVHSVSRFC
jgi:hypothetical protein